MMNISRVLCSYQDYLQQVNHLVFGVASGATEACPTEVASGS